jgi:acyl-CoA reductase-like NAD-dependent aldehyde dehydrogenase
MSIYKEEIFGPVLCMLRSPDVGSAVELINRNEYGNGVAIYTRDGGVAREFVRQIQVGMVVNVPLPVPMAFNSFGGWKRSLFGDHHAYGPEGVRFYAPQSGDAALAEYGKRWRRICIPSDEIILTSFPEGGIILASRLRTTTCPRKP